jgi:hypothetical protein
MTGILFTEIMGTRLEDRVIKAGLSAAIKSLEAFWILAA